MALPKIIYKRLGKRKPSHRNNKTSFGLWKGEVRFRPAGGVIYIDPRQPEDELLDTTVHELLHDAMPYLEEYAVEVYGTHIAQALWRQGWRLSKLPPKPSRK
jgi:hypothetical protein